MTFAVFVEELGKEREGRGRYKNDHGMKKGNCNMSVDKTSGVWQIICMPCSLAV